jgi:hypothetical protein
MTLSPSTFTVPWMVLSGAPCGRAARPGFAADIDTWKSAGEPRSREKANAIATIFFMKNLSLRSIYAFLR